MEFPESGQKIDHFNLGRALPAKLLLDHRLLHLSQAYRFHQVGIQDY